MSSPPFQSNFSDNQIPHAHANPAHGLRLVPGLFALPTRAQIQLRAPGDIRGFGALTSYVELQGFLAQMDSLSTIQVAPLATSRGGRTVSLVRWPEEPNARLTHHGSRSFCSRNSTGTSPREGGGHAPAAAPGGGGKPEWREHLNLLIVPRINPDGAEAGRRRTSDTLDMNRSHVLLHTPEVRALHDLYLAAWPEVTLDIHEYGSFSNSWSDSGFIKTGDVQIGTLTNLNSGAALRSYQRTRIFPYVSAATHCAAVLVLTSISSAIPARSSRHSTTEINDGRQSFGIRGSISFIQEGRKWRDLADHLERRARSQYAGVEALLDFLRDWREIRRLMREGATGRHGRRFKRVYVDGPRPGSRSMTIPVMDVSTSNPRSWTITPYHAVVVPRDSVRLPAAYLVPGALKYVHELLAMHKVRGVSAGVVPIRVEQYQISGFDSLILESDPYRIPQVRVVETVVAPDSGAMIYPVNQDGGLFLGSVLEPRSVWGLSKYAGFEALFRGPVYPVGRIVAPAEETMPRPEGRGETVSSVGTCGRAAARVPAGAA